MEEEHINIELLIKNQYEFFKSGVTRDIEKRREQLLKLKETIIKYEKEIEESVYLDLGKSSAETYLSEIKFVLSEIDFSIKNIKKWAKRQCVPTSLMVYPSRSSIVYEPYGVVLIIAPFNYPFQLLIAPLIGAIAAGNCAIVKPSHLTINTGKILEKIISEIFPERYIAVVNGGPSVVNELLKNKFDYIFFTGGEKFGREVAIAAAKNLTPYTLELGGKSPCIVFDADNLNLCAKRIVWGKFLNAGQTCIAPDYILVKKEQKNELIKYLKVNIQNFFGSNPQLNKYYPRLITENTVERLSHLMYSSGEIIFGGDINIKEKFISPTLIDEPSVESDIMKEEIFGPILPIIGVESLEEAVEFINNREKPLAIYFFGNSKDSKKIIDKTSSGGVCINDTIMHIINPNLPFGGIGNSGIGVYHGEYSFLAFSHKKPCMKRYLYFDIAFRYPPFKIPKWIEKFL
ncbi:MAG: aldehyde dehydrogenase family protein [Bacteroidales bacterium]|nr:aldehyde dehydrogenase family protein [Bacteroidales bacterium]